MDLKTYVKEKLEVTIEDSSVDLIDIEPAFQFSLERGTDNE